jgi:L-malate glycosyltransferase
MLRVVIVGHSYILSEARKKLIYLAGYPELSISLIVPTTWEHAAFGHYEFQPAENDASIAIFPIPIRNNGRVFAFSYQVRPLLRAIRKIRPDIFQIEQELGSLALLQFTFLARLYRAKLIAFTWENLYYRQPGVRNYFEKFELARLDYLLAGNSGSEEVFRRKGYHSPLAVLPNVGVDMEHFSPQPAIELRQALGLNDCFVVGYAGRLAPEKGVVNLIDAFAQLPENCHLLFVGGGPLRDNLQHQAEGLGVQQRVTFQSTVPHSQVPAYLNCMDCLVLPSRTTEKWKEQFGLVLAQAMACGVPVIGSDSGAIPEVIADAGLIFPEGDVAALRGCLLRLQNDPALRAELSVKGRARVLAHYTHERIAEQTVAIYRQLGEK